MCDVVFCAFIFALCALQFAFPLRSNDFFMGDTIYAELAHSIVETGSYGLDYNSMPTPPGLPALLAVICTTAGCDHAVLVRSMSIFLALALLASYWFLKRKEGVVVRPRLVS